MDIGLVLQNYLEHHDEFDGSGVPDRRRWNLYDSAGQAQNANTPAVTTLSRTGSVRDATTVGQYELGDRSLYAYLRSDRESNIEPNKDIQLGGGSVKAQRAPIRFADFWRPLLLLTLLVLGGEWWLYARRS